MRDYIELKQITLHALKNSHPLQYDDIIEKYKAVINSRRTEEMIRIHGDVLKILEKRNALSCDNVTELRHIGGILCNSHLLQKITQYEKCHYGKGSLRPYYVTPKMQINQSKQPSNMQLETNAQQKIYDILTSQLGSDWISFARKLDVPEGDIDTIKMDTNNNLMQKISKTLNYLECRDPVKWFNQICSILEKIGRNDLRRDVIRVFESDRTELGTRNVFHRTENW